MDFEEPQWTAGPDDRTEPGLASDAASGVDHGPSRLQRIGIALFAVCCFFFFLMLKLPEARIQNLIIAHVRIIAQQQGFLFSAEKVRVGILLGPSLKMYNVELKAIDNERQSLKIPYLKIRPKVFSLLSSVKKVAISAELLKGELSGSVGASTAGALAVDLKLDSLDLAATNILKRFLPIDLTAKLDGKVRLDFDPLETQKSDGHVKLTIDKLNLPAQSISGFGIPKISISQANINVVIADGAFTIKEFEVGKEGKGDDIVGRLSGDGKLNRSLDRSTINAKAVFSLSPVIMQSFPLLNALLAQAKTPDGKYAYRLQGPLTALEPIPGQ